MQDRLDMLGYLKRKPVFSFLLGFVIIIFGILISDLPRMIVSTRWPTVEGTITSNRLVGQRFVEYDGDYYTHMDVYIRYEYTLEGVNYHSLSINPIDTPSYPAAYAEKYPVGKEVIVHYNPRDPERAVLEPGLAEVDKAFDVFSFLAFGTGGYLVIHAVRGRRRELSHGYPKV